MLASSSAERTYAYKSVKPANFFNLNITKLRISLMREELKENLF